MDKKILVTGATSFIGRNFIKALIASEKSYEIYAVVREDCVKLDTLPFDDCVRIIRCNMLNYINLYKHISNVDCLFILAWDGTTKAFRDDEEIHKLNLQYSLDVVNIAISLGATQIISAGSQAEYGLHNETISEETECNPVTAYGKYKLKFYNKVADICKKHGIRFNEPRFFSLYGSRYNEHTMIMSTLTKMLKNEPCDFTESIQMWDFMHIDDAVSALVLLLEKPCHDGVYNFGSGIARPLKDFILLMKQLTNSSSELFFDTIEYSDAGMVSLQPDISKLRQEVNFVPQVIFQKGILKIINEYKRQHL